MKKMKFQTMEDFEKELYDFKILFAYHNTRDIFDSGRVVGYTGDLKTLYEIENQKKCYEFLKPYILRKQEIDIDFIKKVHYKLARGTYDEYRYNVNGERAGEFKKHDYVTGKNEVDSYPHEVEKDLGELVKEINDPEIDDYFLVGTYFHAVFEHIHPFADGNGRTGRLLINHELIRNNEMPIVIPDNKRAEYFEYLQNYDVKGLANMIKELQMIEKEKINLYVKEIVKEDQTKGMEYKQTENTHPNVSMKELKTKAEQIVKEKEKSVKESISKNKDISKKGVVTVK